MHNRGTTGGTLATTQPAPPAKHGTTDASSSPGVAPERAKYPHRRIVTDSAWRAAREWISLAFPTDLDAALVELATAYPELATHLEHLRRVAEAEALHYEAEPAATPELFTAALAQWERATMDGLQALAHVQPGATGHQLELEVAHAR